MKPSPSLRRRRVGARVANSVWLCELRTKPSGLSLLTSFTVQPFFCHTLLVAPFILQPNQRKTGRLNPFTGGVHSYFYLHQKEYRPLTITLTRGSNTDPHIVLYVSTRPEASIDNHFWSDSTLGDGVADVVIDNAHPAYCEDCNYYVGVYYLEDEVEGPENTINLEVTCPDNVCVVCKDGFDPSTNCKTCLPGFYGQECTKCPNCNHGKCDDGQTGSGICICDEGWGPAETCSECLSGFWGLNCDVCPDCHMNGDCNDGLHGTGKCICDEHFDERVDCEDCIKGYYGKKCTDMCPATEDKICSGHGMCNDGVAGSGWCTCDDNYVGMKCDTLYDNDKCSPHCVTDHGACDEDLGICICKIGFEGKDCGKDKGDIYLIISIVSVVAFAVVLTLLCIRLTRKEKKSKKALLNDMA